MGLASDQTHQSAAALAKQRREGFGLFGYYVFHGATVCPARPPSILFLCNLSLRESAHWNHFVHSGILLHLR